MRVLMCILTGRSIALMASKSITPLLFQPIEVVVVLKAFSVEKIFEDGPKCIVVWPLFEGKSPDGLHVGDELIRDFRTKFLQSHLTFLRSDHFIFFFLICNFDTLPGQIASHEVDQDEA